MGCCLDINNNRIFPSNTDYQISDLTVKKLDRVSEVTVRRGYQSIRFTDLAGG